jgi:hypothetical protein
LDHAVGYCSHYFGSGCCSLFPLFLTMLLVTIPIIWMRLLVTIPIIWIRLLVTVPIILDQTVDHCFHYFGSGCCLLFPLFWMRLLVTVPITLDQAVN